MQICIHLLYTGTFCKSIYRYLYIWHGSFFFFFFCRIADKLETKSKKKKKMYVSGYEREPILYVCCLFGD